MLIFACTQILPGDVAQSILGQSATPDALTKLRGELGPRPSIVRYFQRLGGVLTGDLGTALTTRQGITATAAAAAVELAVLAGWAAVVSFPLATILGLLAVLYLNGMIDARGNPQHHAVGLHRDGGVEGLFGVQHYPQSTPSPTRSRPSFNVVMLNLAFRVVGVVAVE